MADMDPQTGRMALASGATVFLLALVILPLIDPESPQFVADVLALILSGIFLAVVSVIIWRGARPPIDSDSENE
jgi:hypothetical protein